MTDQNANETAKPKKKCRACYDFQTWMRMNMKDPLGDPPPAPSTSAAPPTEKRTTPKTTASPKKPVAQTSGAAASSGSPDASCPVDKNELGRATWSFIHTVAANYPDEPNLREQGEMNQFINLFAKFYPCEYCAADLRAQIRTHPPQLHSQEHLSRWWCKMHNTINRKLGKPEFDCNLVDERWRDGWKDGSCG